MRGIDLKIDDIWVLDLFMTGHKDVMYSRVHVWKNNLVFYMLASGVNGTLYIGVTSNLIGRVYQHRQNLVVGFTQCYDVHNLV